MILRSFRYAVARLIAPEFFADLGDEQTPRAQTAGRSRFGVTADLLKLAEMFSKHSGRSEATISNRIGGHARLFQRLRQGHGCTIKTADRALDWFEQNWPADLEWPAAVIRPSTIQKRRAA